ncbi:hypothetical protein [Salinispora arenicola]|uniref:hypothetical protein n=1 Tax=Salinispora arenicola TaxID=168697 RepID=UPI0027DD2E44|nr:hypothetical protein [Salinispora arenicola]
MYPVASRWPGQVSGVRLPKGQDPADLLGTLEPMRAITEITGAIQPLAHVQMTNTIDRLFATKRITDPVRFAEDRITAYRAIAELFVDAPHANRDMAETAAEQLGLDSELTSRTVSSRHGVPAPTPPAEPTRLRT